MLHYIALPEEPGKKWTKSEWNKYMEEWQTQVSKQMEETGALFAPWPEAKKLAGTAGPAVQPQALRQFGATMRAASSTDCYILTFNGLAKAQHGALRCGSQRCPSRGKLAWANVIANEQGCHAWTSSAQQPEIAMFSPRLGVA